jgi:hypothetical protein
MGPEMLLVPISECLQNNLTNSNRNCECPDGRQPGHYTSFGVPSGLAVIHPALGNAYSD